ncbi:shikimate dehydrogenase [Pontibacter sp. BT310]|uniref:Shikimate dehydrogenase n=1 Tax=Pontibacter populi TaxID=890055 RepID=A0ABS6X803_9BACT|nr:MULTISPECIES: shikimate dehydrogenase [Pontibacter]MBJ6117276.1 shikimate dehydrogenase [Pontibacter sp. BT310]MBR0569701.1 shikimate dehydrogenase [Microvirga sp. STS03]MBW3364129.1 shikimate dehydrogenase [Pontibacter populi]
MQRYGLIGKKLGHSFSKRYFTEKFEREGIADATYELYELATIAELPQLLQKQPDLVGLNVTVPYKETVIPFLDELDEAAARIGAVNTIKIAAGKTKGYNTDYIGFRDSLEQVYPATQNSRALVLGTGGASKAVVAALQDLQINYTILSRQAGQGRLTYADLTPELLKQYQLIVNTTPLGMYPAVENCPELPYEALSAQHCLYDLVYNPEQTLFLEKGKSAGAQTINGLRMLYGQAEAAWQIWQNR